MNNNAKVTLVGAGPGDVELITLKGFKAIKNADIILYDALVNKELLEFAKKETSILYVGKRFNKHAYNQDEINHLLVEKALTYGNVVRLKGGDPFIFGRGSEEVDYVESFGIKTEIIPGISSALAVPANQGIPLTKRGINTSFWVVTGNTKDDTISKDLVFASQSSATLVILMGLRNISTIINEVSKYRSGFTPMAVIQNGTTKNEKISIGDINSVDEIKQTIDYSSPGIIIVGDVVAEHPGYFDEEIQRVLASADIAI